MSAIGANASDQDILLTPKKLASGGFQSLQLLLDVIPIVYCLHSRSEHIRAI